MANIFRIDRPNNKIELGTTGTAINLTPMTQGSILFAGASGLLSQDNSNLFWDDTNDRLGIGTTTPTRKLTIIENNVDAIFIRDNDGTNASTLGLGINTTTGFAYIQSRDAAAGVTQPLTFWVGSTEKFRIGTTGIFTLTPDANTDLVINFVGTTNSGVLTWMEDEDRFDFADAVKVTGFHGAITTKTNTDYTLTINDDVVLFDTGATTRIATLPAASTVTGKIYHIKKIDAGVGLVTIDGNASETIDGDLTPDITAQYESFMIVSDGSNWHVI